VEDDCGTFLLDDGSVRTFSLKHVTEAVARLKNKIPVHLSEYKKDFKFGGKDNLDYQEERIVGEELRVLMEKSLAEYRATAPAKPVRTAAVQKPTPPKSIFPHPSRSVTKIASPSGISADFPELMGPTECGWYQGQLKKFIPNDPLPYVIRWSSKPAIEMQVSERIMRQLVMNYKYCDENDIFKGIVGKEILWVCRDKISKGSLRFVKVLRFPTKGSRLFELAFRDGKIMEVSPEHLDRAFARDERLQSGKAVITNFTDPAASEVMYTLANINYAEQEKMNYPLVKSVWHESLTYGSDFSSSSSQDGHMIPKVVNDEKTTLLGEGQDDPSTTATVLIALSETRAEGTHGSLGNTYPPPNITKARKERARKIAKSTNQNVNVTGGNEPKGKELVEEATVATEKAEAFVHNNDEDTDMSLAEGKVTKINDVEVGAQGGVKEIALEPSLNVTPVAEQETSNQPDQDEVCRSGLQPSDKVNQEHVTTAAVLGTTNKSDTQEEGLRQHPFEVNKDAKEDEGITTEDEDEGGENPRKPVSLCVGTNVCSWFLNREAYVNTPAVEVAKLQQEWTIKYGAQSKRLKQGWEADGEWYNGKVTNVRKTSST